MKFRLRYQQHDLELIPGQFIIGRSSSCQLSVDDPLVSRMHAMLTVSEDEVIVEDLGSRNGVRVNGEMLSSPRRVSPGDLIGIGNQELSLLEQRPAVRAENPRLQMPTQRFNPLGVVAILADKAFALGRADEAERLLEPQLKQLLTDVREGRSISTQQLEQAATYSVRLADMTGREAWVNLCIELYASVGGLLPAPLIDQLYAVLRKVGQVDLTGLRDYIRVLRERVDKFGPAERFLLGRIEGLERLAASK